MTEFVDCDSDIELFEMSAEKSEKALLVNTTDRDKISYSSADDSVNVGNEPGHRKVVLNKQKEKTKLSGFLLLLSFFAAIGGFLFGYDTGVVSGAMLLLKTNFDLSSFSEEVIVSVTIGSAAVFSICSGVLNEYLGRKLTIIIGSFVFTAGAIVLAVAQNIAMLISGRAILGIGIGIASMTVPTYIAECAPSELRGRLVTINNLFITGGQFIASVLDGAFSYDKTNGWRYMFGLAGVPSAIQFVGFFFLPESPRWLISKGKEVEARKVLCKIRGHSYVEEELQEIIQKFEEERESTNNKAEEYIIVRVIKTPSVRRALILGSFLQIFQQLSGINTVMYYSATIIQMTGIRSQSTAIWLAAVTAFVNFIFTLVGVWLVDKIGRRKLILSSLAGVLFSLVVLAVGFQVTALNSPPVTTFESSSNNSKCFQYRSCESCTESLQCGFCYIEKNTYSAENGSCLPYTDPSMSSEGRCNSTKLQINLVWAENYCPSPYSILGLIGLIIYLMAFAPGMGPMPWTINSEIYPLWARSTCTAISTSFNWIFNLTVSLSFLTLTEQITKYDHEDTGGSKFYVVFLTMFATIGGLLFGYDTGIISGSMLLMKDYFNLTTVYQEAIVSATIGAAALFALIAGIITERFGRKVVIMIASFVFTGGAVMMALSNSKEILLIGRLVVGAGIGFASMSVPIYVAEAAPASIRGALVSLNQLFITIGILLSSIVAGAFSGDKENGWRYMLGIAGVPSIIQFVGFFFLPESPRYLVNKGKVEEARKVLEKLRDSSNVDNEMRDIEKSVKESREFEQSNVFATIGKMLGNQPVRKALLLGCLMQFFQQLCGINTVIYYSASILRMSGFPSKLAIWLVCVPFAVNFLATFLGIYLVERAGRRILTLGSFVGIIIALIVLAVGFQLSVIHTPPVSHNETSSSKCEYSKCDPCVRNKDCGFCYIKDNPTTTGSCLPVYSDHPERYADPNFQNGTGNFRCNETNYEHDMKDFTWADNYCPTEYSWMAVLGLALFVIGFAPGLGPMPWTVNSEIYPIWARGTAISISTAVNWIANLIVSFTFLSLLESITTYGTFYLFCGISVLGLIVLYFMLPETKNKTLEEVEQLFMSEEYRSQHKKYMTYEAKDNPAFAGEKL